MPNHWNLPKDWEWVKIGDMSELVSKGTTPTTLGISFSSSGIPFLRAEDVVGEAVNPRSVKYYIDKKTHKIILGRSQLKPGDFLITIAGSLGRVGYVPANVPEMNCNQAVAFVRLKPNSIDMNYLLFVFQYEHITRQLLENKKVGTIGNLNLEQIRDFAIPLPPLPEQRRIAALLSRADRLRRLRRVGDGLSASLLQSVFLEMFGNPAINSKGFDIHRFEDVLETPPQNGLYLPEEQYEPKDSKNGVEMVHMADAFYELVERGRLRRVRISDKDKEKYAISEKDLLIARRSLNFEGAAKPCLIPKSDEPLVFESSMIRITPNQKIILPLYLFYYLTNEIAKKTHVLKYVTKSTISGINQDNLKSIEVIVPPLPEQERFAVVVRQVESLRRRQAESARQGQGLFESLLQAAFHA